MLNHFRRNILNQRYSNRLIGSCQFKRVFLFSSGAQQTKSKLSFEDPYKDLYHLDGYKGIKELEKFQKLIKSYELFERRYSMKIHNIFIVKF